MSTELIRTLRETLCEVGRRVYEKGWVASNDGNLSIRVTSDQYLITPSGVSKGALTPAGILLVDGSGHTLDGDGRVSTEWKMHQKVYERRPEIGAVVHTHAPYSTAFAVAGQPLDLPVLPELVYHLGAVPLVPYYLPGAARSMMALIPSWKGRMPFCSKIMGWSPTEPISGPPSIAMSRSNMRRGFRRWPSSSVRWIL